VVQAGLDKKHNPVSRITRAKGWGYGSHGTAPSKHEALRSNPSTAKKILLLIFKTINID
jgi:hypothetical protein